MADLVSATLGDEDGLVAVRGAAEARFALLDTLAYLNAEAADTGYGGGTALTNTIRERLAEIGTAVDDEVSSVTSLLEGPDGFTADGQLTELAALDAMYVSVDAALLRALSSGQE